MTTRIYWDSCAFIHPFGETQKYLNPLRMMMSQAKAISKEKPGQCVIVTSAFTMAEVYKLPDQGILPVEQSKKIMDCLENSYIEVIQADRYICRGAHELQRDYPDAKLRPADAVHLATAISAKVDSLITTDVKKYRRNGLLAHDRMFGNPKMRIQVPTDAVFGELFEIADEEKQSNIDARPEAGNG